MSVRYRLECCAVEADPSGYPRARILVVSRSTHVRVLLDFLYPMIDYCLNRKRF